VRIQAVCTGAMAGRLSNERLLKVLQDSDAQVRRRAIPLLEERSIPAQQLTEVLTVLSTDEDDGVVLQLACTLGSLQHPAVPSLLGNILISHYEQEWIRKACRTSLRADNVEQIFAHVAQSSVDSSLVLELIEQCQRFGRVDAIQTSVLQLLDRTVSTQRLTAEQLHMAAELIRLVERTGSLSAADDIVTAVEGVIQKTAPLVQSATLDEALLVAGLDVLSALRSGSLSPDDRLQNLIQPSQSTQVQQAALEVLMHHNAIESVFTEWGVLSPARRSQALESITRRPESVEVLLDAVMDGGLAANDIDAVYRDRLINHPTVDIRRRAKRVLGVDQATPRNAVVDEWNDKLADVAGRVVPGEAIFRKRCATCHRLNEIGNQIGADLSSLQDRSTSALVTAVLDPNKAVESRFLSYTAVLTDGRTMSGMLKNETDSSVTLLGTDGKPLEIVRTDIEEMLASRRSFMPDGLEKDLSPKDLADVIAFVQSAGTPWKQFDGNMPQVVSVDDDGVLWLPAAAAEIYGPSVEFDGTQGHIANWMSQHDRLVWQADVKGWGFWNVEFEYSCRDSNAGNQLQLATQARMMTASVPGTGQADEYRRWKAGAIELSPGSLRLTLSAPQQLRTPLFELRGIRLTQPKK